jgi:serine-type D-Ala-D-Ala carboxypeptidase/endopeptidase
LLSWRCKLDGKEIRIYQEGQTVYCPYCQIVIEPNQALRDGVKSCLPRPNDYRFRRAGIMRKKLFGLLALYLFFSIFANISIAQDYLSCEQIKETIKKEVDNGRSVSIVVGIINGQGQQVISYGQVSRDSKKEANGDTLYEIGSITKTFTAIILEAMVEQGDLNLSDPISKFLPKSVKTPTRNGKEITLLDLVTHHSGLPRRPDNMKPVDPNNPYSDYTIDQLYDFLSHYQLTCDIGEKFEYSNLGFGLLGHILCLKTGLDYETLVHRYICDPLKMGSTVIKLTPEFKSRMATGHDKTGTPVENWDLSTLAGAGALCSSANDMLIYVRANLGLIKTNLLQVMQQTHITLVLGTPHNNIGMAWLISRPLADKIIWHNGGTGGFQTFIGFDEERKIGVVVLSNSANQIDDLGFHFLDSRIPVKEYHKGTN